MIKIQKVTLNNGEVRYRARGVSVGKNPATGKRAQRTITCRTKREVEAELRRIGYAVDRGTYRAPWHGLVGELVDSYLKHGAIDWEANTRLSYEKALLPAREWFAHRKARDVTREQVEEYRDHLRTAGRRRGGAQGTGLSARSVNLSLQQLQAAYELAERDGKVAVNPVRFVKRVKREDAEHDIWTEEQLQRFIAAAAADRLHACWLLSALGLRRAEVLGLKWNDIDFGAGTLTITRSRVLVDYKPIEKCPKSKRSARTLPLLEPAAVALKALRKRQLEERLATGEAYQDSGYVACDELGEPLPIERYSDEFARIVMAAGLPRVRLHDTRSVMNGILERAGVSESLRAAWLGHTVAVNKSAYLRPPSDLAPVSDAIGRIFEAV
jgi:integrase